MSKDIGELENSLNGIKKNEVIRDHVSMGVGGVADLFYVAKNIEELSTAAKLAYENDLPYFILGDGNNIIPSDSGFPGIIIKNESENIIFSPGSSVVIADSGVRLSKLINLAASRDLGGLEFLSGVPGTVGGAVYGNAGSKERAIGDFVKSLTLLIPRNGKMVMEYQNSKWMNFSYRSSTLKEAFDGTTSLPVILTVTLQLVQRRKDEIIKLMQEKIRDKKENQPLNDKSAGSFFKNPEGFYAGQLLEKSGANRQRIGGAAFAKKHANFLINKKNARASDIRELAEKAKELVFDKYKVQLKEEVEYIGKW